MGRMKDLMIDMENQSEERQLAKLLGLTYDELTSTDYELIPETDKNSVLYNYKLTFPDDTPAAILQKVKGLQEGFSINIDPQELDVEYNYYYDEEYAAILDNRNYYKKFTEEIQNLSQLNDLLIENDKLQAILKRQIYISVIGTMEIFLSDTFIHLTDEKKAYFENFIKTHPAFKERKFELSQIYEVTTKLNATVKTVMIDMIYHNLPAVKKMYESTFEMEFPAISKVFPMVLKRHDLVHRNGKTKAGTLVDLNTEVIEELIREVSSFIFEIVTKLKLQ